VTGCIVGCGAYAVRGRLDTETVESLIVRVATEALADAGIAPSDVDEIVLGHFNAGFSQQDFTASLVLQASPDLRFKARDAGRERLRDRLGCGGIRDCARWRRRPRVSCWSSGSSR